MSSRAFYDPQNRELTISIDGDKDWSYFVEDDKIVYCFENLEEIEFYWPPDEQLWRAVPDAQRTLVDGRDDGEAPG